MSYQKVKDIRLDELPADKQVYDVVEGGQATYTIVQPQGNVSTSQNTYNFPNTNESTGRNLKINMHAIGTITLTTTNTVDISQLKSGCLGFKPFPLNRCLAVSHTINSATETLNTYQYIDVLANLDMLPKDVNYYNNSTADLYCDYSALTGSLINPLAFYSGTAVGGSTLKPRNFGITNITVTATSVTISFDLYEPLISPFTLMKSNDTPSLFNISNESIILNFQASMQDMIAYVPSLLSDAGNATVTAVNVALTQLTLESNYVTKAKSEGVVKQSIFRYPKLQLAQSAVFSTNAIQNEAVAGTPTVLPNATVTANWQILPDLIVFVARPSATVTNRMAHGAATVGSMPDRFFQLSAPNIVINNSPSQLVGLSQRQMYEISKRNGYSQNYEIFSAMDLSDFSLSLGSIVGSGSVLCLSPALDLGICLKDLSNNSNVNYTITGSFTVTNNQVAGAAIPNPSTVNNPTAELDVIVINWAELVRDDALYTTRLVQYDNSEVGKILGQNSDSATFVQSERDKPAMRSGGNFFSNFWKGFKMPFQFAWDHKDDIGKVAKAVGLGLPHDSAVKRKAPAKHSGLKLRSYA